MLSVVGRRILAAIPLLLIVSALIFVLVDLAPGDVAATVAGEGASPERVAEVREELGLNDPIYTRYGRWLGDAVQGDLGASLTTGRSVLSTVIDRAPITLSLMLVALVISISLALVGGILAALRPGGIMDRLVTALSSVAIGVPNFWLGLILLLVFAVQLGWLPALGYTPLSEGFWPWLRHLLLPAISLAGVPLAEFARQLRGSMRDVMGRDFVVTARAKGLRSGRVVIKHTLKNAAIPVVTVLGFRVAQMIGGSVVVERVFTMRGLGSYAVESVLTRDIPAVQAVVVVTTVVVVVANLLVDISYAYFNPKVRQA